MAPLTLSIRLSSGSRFSLDLGESDLTSVTVRQVKERIAATEYGVEPDRQRLIFKGRILDNERTLADYEISHEATLFLVKSSAPPASQASAPGDATATTSTNPTPNNSTASNRTASTNPWGSQPGSSAFPPLPNMDPQQMQQMMNSPAMQGLLDNPELFSSMMQMQMQSNPQLRQMMEQNPQLQHVLNDPAMMQQAIQMMRNPQLMQQAMRQQDLAMLNLENVPGGFNALRSMYQNVQAPLEESLQRDEAPSAGSRDAANAQAGASGTAMPNPWGTTTPNPRNTSNAVNNSRATTNPWNSPTTSNDNQDNGDNPFPTGMPPPAMMNNPDAVLQMMENPFVQQMMNQMMEQNPDMFRQMLEQSNPMLANMFRDNPEMGNQFIRQMMNPQVMRSMLNLQQGMNAGRSSSSGASNGGLDFSSLLLAQQSSAYPGPHVNTGGDNFGTLLSQMQGTHLQQQPHQAPTDRYSAQLRSLYDMGFDDEQRNMVALQRAHGNLNRAVDMLLGGEIPETVSTPPSRDAGPDDTNESSLSTEEPPTPPKSDQDKKNE